MVNKSPPHAHRNEHILTNRKYNASNGFTTGKKKKKSSIAAFLKRGYRMIGQYPPFFFGHIDNRGLKPVTDGSMAAFWPMTAKTNGHVSRNAAIGHTLPAFIEISAVATFLNVAIVFLFLFFNFSGQQMHWKYPNQRESKAVKNTKSECKYRYPIAQHVSHNHFLPSRE